MNATVFNFQANTEFEFVVKNPPDDKHKSICDAGLLWYDTARRLNDEVGSLRINTIVHEAQLAVCEVDQLLACYPVLVFRGSTIYQSPDGMRHWRDSVYCICRHVAKALDENGGYGTITFRECEHGRV